MSLGNRSVWEWSPTKQTLNCWEYCLLHLATAVTLMTVTMVEVFLDHIIEMSWANRKNVFSIHNLFSKILLMQLPMVKKCWNLDESIVKGSQDPLIRHLYNKARCTLCTGQLKLPSPREYQPHSPQSPYQRTNSITVNCK